MLLHITTLAQRVFPHYQPDIEVYKPTQIRQLKDERSYTLVATVPGVAAHAFSLSVSDEGLIKMEAKSPDGREVLQRTLRLAEDADVTAVMAICTDGMLVVAVSKLQPPAPRSIPVQESEPTNTHIRQSIDLMSSSFTNCRPYTIIK
jgi:HSP20 family molecular chaperone IbpA